jgi:hypothetical protein
MGKAISQTKGAHNLRVTLAIAALAAVLIVLTLVAVLQTAPTTSDSAAKSANHAISADGTGGSRSVNYDPAIDRHAEVVQRLGGGNLP